jgi:hypothetical protein
MAVASRLSEDPSLSVLVLEVMKSLFLDQPIRLALTLDLFDSRLVEPA